MTLIKDIAAKVTPPGWKWIGLIYDYNGGGDSIAQWEIEGVPKMYSCCAVPRGAGPDQLAVLLASYVEEAQKTMEAQRAGIPMIGGRYQVRGGPVLTVEMIDHDAETVILDGWPISFVEFRENYKPEGWWQTSDLLTTE